MRPGLDPTNKNLRYKYFFWKYLKILNPQMFMEKSKQMGTIFWCNLLARFMKIILKNFRQDHNMENWAELSENPKFGQVSGNFAHFFVGRIKPMA